MIFFRYLYRTLIEGDAKAGLSIFWADDVCEIDTVVNQRCPAIY